MATSCCSSSDEKEVVYEKERDEDESDGSSWFFYSKNEGEGLRICTRFINIVARSTETMELLQRSRFGGARCNASWSWSWRRAKGGKSPNVSLLAGLLAFQPLQGW